MLISLVKEKGTQNNTIYQTSSSVAKKLHNNDNNTRIWVLISDSYKDIDTDKINELTDVKDYIEGINMKAKNVDEKDIKAIHDLGLTICSFSYTSKMYSNASAETLKSWGTNYLMANNIDE